MHPVAVAGAIAALMLPSLAAAQAYGSTSPDSDSFGATQNGPPSDWGVGLNRHWARGHILPPNDRNDPISDYDSFHLRRPPPGYQWYQCDDEFILASTTSGMIFEVIDAH